MTAAPGRSMDDGRLGWIGQLTLFAVAGLAETVFYGQTNALPPSTSPTSAYHFRR